MIRYEKMTVEELKITYEAEYGIPASDRLISIFDICGYRFKRCLPQRMGTRYELQSVIEIEL